MLSAVQILGTCKRHAHYDFARVKLQHAIDYLQNRAANEIAGLVFMDSFDNYPAEYSSAWYNMEHMYGRRP